MNLLHTADVQQHFQCTEKQANTFLRQAGAKKVGKQFVISRVALDLASMFDALMKVRDRIERIFDPLERYAVELAMCSLIERGFKLADLPRVRINHLESQLKETRRRLEDAQRELAQQKRKENGDIPKPKLRVREFLSPAQQPIDSRLGLHGKRYE